VVTASRNGGRVLRLGGLVGLFDTQVDGLTIEELALPGKPDPATYLEAAHRLGVPASRAVVIEDSQAGVEAGRRGGFGLVVALDRSGSREALLRAGADLLVADLAAVNVTGGRS
jgi:beta-phosphoglucomutase-like phosphatase (HAD superfamily)